MINEPNPDILIQAEAVYKGAVTDPGKFGGQAARLVDVARAAGDAEALVVSLRALARCHYSRLEHRPAKALLDDASRVARRHSLAEREGEILMSRAAVNIELGLMAAAQHDLDRAATLVTVDGQAVLALQQAALQQNLGRYAEAAAAYRRLLQLAMIPPDVEAKALNNLALIESDRGRPDVSARKGVITSS